MEATLQELHATASEELELQRQKIISHTGELFQEYKQRMSAQLDTQVAASASIDEELMKIDEAEQQMNALNIPPPAIAPRGHH